MLFIIKEILTCSAHLLTAVEIIASLLLGISGLYVGVYTSSCSYAGFRVQELKVVLVVRGIVCDAPPWLPLDSCCNLKEEFFLKTIVPHFQSQGFSKDTRSLTEALEG